MNSQLEISEILQFDWYGMQQSSVKLAGNCVSNNGSRPRISDKNLFAIKNSLQGLNHQRHETIGSD